MGLLASSDGGHVLDQLFLAITFIIPKAGAQLANVPLTFNLLLLAAVLLCDVPRTFEAPQINGWIGFLYYGFLMVAIVSTVLLNVGKGVFSLAQNIVVMFSPMAIVAARRVPRDTAMRIAVVSLLVVNLVGLLQYFFGINEMSVAGLTYTYGQDLASKPIGYGSLSTNETNKIISTYQNGNSYGIFCALAVSLAIGWEVEDACWRKLRFVSTLFGVLGLLICGSRSIVLPSCVVGLYLVAQRLHTWKGYAWRRNFLLLLVAFAGIVLYVLYSNSSIVANFADRIIGQTLGDTTASGRTTQWAEIWNGFLAMSPAEAVRFLLLGQGEPYDLGGEGFPEFVCRFGLLAAVLFYELLFMTAAHFLGFEKTRPLGAGMLCVIFAFCVDQSYYYPPTVMEYFLAAGIGLSLLNSDGRARRQHDSPGQCFEVGR